MLIRSKKGVYMPNSKFFSQKPRKRSWGLQMASHETGSLENWAVGLGTQYYLKIDLTKAELLDMELSWCLLKSWRLACLAATEEACTVSIWQGDRFGNHFLLRNSLSLFPIFALRIHGALEALCKHRYRPSTQQSPTISQWYIICELRI